MNLYVIPPLVTMILIALMGFLVYSRNRKSDLNRSFSLFCASMTLWLLGFTAMYASHDQMVALRWARLGFAGVTFIPPTMLQFVLIFLRRNHQALIRGLYVVSIFGLAVGTTSLVYKGVWVGFWGFYPIAGLLYPIFLVTFLICFIGGVALLQQSLKGETEPRRRQQIKWVMFAYACGTPGLIDYIVKYQIYIYPFGYVAALFFISLMAYAILAHQLMEIHIVIRKTLIYSLVSAVLTCIYFFVVTSLANVSSGWIGKSSFVSIALAGVVVTLIFLPLYRRIQRFVDRHFFREALDQALLREATSGFVHEIKRPLANISLPAELALSDLQDLKAKRRSLAEVLPKIEQRLEYILSQTADAGNTIEAINHVSSANGDCIDEVDLLTVIEKSLTAEESLLRRYQVQTRKELADVPKIRGHAKQLEIAIGNLIKNAAEAMSNLKSKRTIDIKARASDQKIIITVQDSGDGINPKDQPRIFEPYFSTKGVKGKGMGLYLCRQIVQEHHGSLEVTSRPGEGATFRMELPLPENGGKF